MTVTGQQQDVSHEKQIQKTLIKKQINKKNKTDSAAYLVVSESHVNWSSKQLFCQCEPAHSPLVEVCSLPIWTQ